VTVTRNDNLDNYRFAVRRLTKEAGGGYLVEFPEVPGCMSDGETIEEAIANGRQALRDTLDVFQESGRKTPRSGASASRGLSISN
jgi:antitoxin HicB